MRIGSLGWAALLLLLFTAGATAADNRQLLVRPELDPLPAELYGVEVILRQTPNPQIVITNLTPDPLFIQDDYGRPFLWIDAQGVKADYATEAFHRSRYANQRPLPNNAHGPPRWHTVNPVHIWAWFDTRLRPQHKTQGDITDRWRIPVQLGDTMSAITGRFVQTAAPDGIYQAIITNQAAQIPHLSAHSLTGIHAGVFLHNRGNAAFDITGTQGEDFLRFLPGKVMVNRSSPTWRAAAPPGAVAPYRPAAGEAHTWTVVSADGGFGWADPRLQPEGPHRQGDTRQQVKSWTLPMFSGGHHMQIKGYTQWLPPPH